jgi:peroxiredoxin
MKRMFILIFLVLSISSFSLSGLKAEAKVVAPNFKLMDLSGATVELKSYINKQPVLLFFWTTWCPFCLKEIKVLNTDRKSLEEKGIAVLAINAGESERAVKRLVKNYNLDLKVLLDENALTADDYGVIGVPTFVLIDQNGGVLFNDNYYPHQELRGISSQK